MSNYSDYYVKQTSKLLKDFNKITNIAKKILAQSFDELKINQILEKSKSNFLHLIPQLPYIGGERNVSTFNIIEGAWILAIVFPLEQEGLNVREIGKIIYGILEKYFKSKPFSNWWNGLLMCSKFMIKKRKKSCENPQFQKYPEGWVEKFVEGDGRNFDYGIDITDCGLYKLFKKHDAEKYLYYICLGDYPMYKSYGIGFTRTQTIANGAKICNFRYKKGGKTADGWPPDKLPDWKE